MSSPDPDHIFLESKKECTALALSASGGEGTFLVAGSRDGVIRVYQPPSTKVVRAVNGFGDEISSIAILPSSPTNVKAENGGDGPALRFWVACGRKVCRLFITYQYFPWLTCPQYIRSSSAI